MQGLIAVLVIAAIVNLIPDYISLLESRLVIRWMSSRASLSRIVALLVLDVVATAAVFLLGFDLRLGVALRSLRFRSQAGSTDRCAYRLAQTIHGHRKAALPFNGHRRHGDCAPDLLGWAAVCGVLISRKHYSFPGNTQAGSPASAPAAARVDAAM